MSQAHEQQVHAAASAIQVTGNELPGDIQWMPPGRQLVQPLGFDAPFEMNVTPLVAAAADRQLQHLRSSAAAGRDAQPYGDFNHKDEGRAYLAKRFWWGGDDAKTGGVRLDVEWTGAGAKAVREGELCCNSPSWVLNKVSKAFLGISHNVGGLVPRSAFHSIQAFAKAETGPAHPISSRNGGEENHQQHQHHPNMAKTTEEQLADLSAAVGKLTTTVGELVTAQAKASAKETSAPAADPKITSIEAELKAIKEAQVAQAKATGAAKIQQAIKDGKIPAQAKDTITQLEEMYAANAKAADAFIDALPVNEALKNIVAKAGADTTTTSTGEHEFVAKAKAYAKAQNITDEVEAQAKFAATPEGGKLYTGYCEALTARK